MFDRDALLNKNDLYSREYLLLEYRLYLNKKLYENKSISFDVFRKMEESLIKKQNRLLDINNTPNI